MRWDDYVIIRFMFAVYLLIIGILWCFDKVRALCGKESLLDRWTNTW